MSIKDIKLEILKGWGRTSILRQSIRILNFMSHAKTQELRMITFPDIVKATKSGDITSDLLATIAVLTSDKINVLKTRALFHDDDGDEYEIPNIDIEKARENGGLPHPVSGIIVEDFDQYIIPYFEASSHFIKENKSA